MRGGGAAARWALWALVLALAGGPAAADTWLAGIGDNLSKLSGELTAVEVDYDPAPVNTTYESRVEFDMRAMGPLYNSTKMVIDFIAKKDAYPEGIVTVADGHLEVAPLGEHWRPLLAFYAGPAAVLAAALLLAVALPLAGLFWCCCVCCSSGRRRQPFDRKYDACVKGLLAIILIGLLTLFLFGVVCAFATEEQLEAGAGAAGGGVRRAGRDAQAFLNATQAHARWLLVHNYRQLQARLDDQLTTSGLKVSNQLSVFSRAVSVTTLHRLVQQLDGVRRDLAAVRNLTDALRLNAERLNTGLRSVKAKLLHTLAKCEHQQCRRLQEKYKIGQLDTEIQYSRMPDVSELLANVSALLDSNIEDEVDAGQRRLADVQRAVQRSVDTRVPAVRAALQDTGRRLEHMADEISAACGRAAGAVQRAAPRAAAGLDDAHAHYGAWRRLLGLAAASALLAITVCVTLGLVCGVCGKRPDAYGAADCCNKGQGARWLNCGAALMLVLGGAVALALGGYFLLGVLAQRFVCDPLTVQRDNRLFGDLERIVDFEQALFDEHKDPDFNMTAAIERCHRNETIFVALHLHRKFDLEAVRAELADGVARHVAQLRPLYAAGSVVILRAPARAKLQQLAASGLAEFNFDRILQALETNVTSLALDALAAQLEGAARELQARPGLAALSGDLRDAAALLAGYQERAVRPLLAHTLQLNETAVGLRDRLRFNHSAQELNQLIEESIQAERFLNTQGPELIQNLSQSFAESVAASLGQYLDMVGRAARRDVARCGPLSHAYNSTRAAACTSVLQPVNGYWISLAWCMLLLPALLLAARRLARLYTHLDPYPGPLVEAEYEPMPRAGCWR